MTKPDKQNSFPKQNFNSWLNTISSLLGEVSRVEISTMIVDEITEDVFLPYEVYQVIYSISPIYLAELEIDESLCDRYLRLRRQLELQYALLLTDENSIFYSEKTAQDVKRDLPVLAQDTTPWENLPFRLPSPVNSNPAAGNGVLYHLLAEPSFKSILRQLGNIKTALDRRNLRFSASVPSDYTIHSDITYAHTVIQLDGKISHRYASEIIQHPQQQDIVKLHQKGVEAGTKQWHKLFQFVTEIIQRQQKF